eukprot:4205022-Pyramimonas_sp.AAC.1
MQRYGMVYDMLCYDLVIDATPCDSVICFAMKCERLTGATCLQCLKAKGFEDSLKGERGRHSMQRQLRVAVAAAVSSSSSSSSSLMMMVLGGAVGGGQGG